MTTWGDRIMRAGRADIGVGVSVPPAAVPDVKSIIHSDWTKGLITITSDENLPPSIAKRLQDIECRNANSLVRAPGIVLLEDVSPRSLRWLFEHASFDYATALVAIDPPFVGVKTSTVFAFTNKAIAATGTRGWRVTNVAGTLLFSNGTTASYLRNWATGVITDITAEVIAEAFGNAFARTFAGAYTDAGGFQALGIMWNAASGDPADWSGLGSGAQLLISNQPESDMVVAIVPIGFDALGVLNRRTIWIGYPTGDSNAPADFRIRYPALGCVARRTAVATPIGPMALSDKGVFFFNINEAKVVSGPINNLLLPIDYLNLDKYYAIFNTTDQRYQLYTPTGVFIYDLEDDRWFYRSYFAEDSSAVMFASQSGNVFWNTVVGTWAAQLLTWNQMIIGEQDAPSVVTNGAAGLLGQESEAVSAYFLTAQDAYYITPQAKESVTDQVLTASFAVEYLSDNDSVIKFERLDENGAASSSCTRTLVDTNNVRRKKLIPVVLAGQGTTVKITIVSGYPEIFLITHTYEDLEIPTLSAG